MIPGLGLIQKIVLLGIDLFVKNRSTKSKLKQQFYAFFKKSGDFSKKSSEMSRDYDKMRKNKDLWHNKDG